MKTFLILLATLSNISHFFSLYIDESHHSQIIDNFAFGSCFIGRSSTRFDMFKTIQKNHPQLWIWLGDAAYADNLVKVNGTLFNYEFSIDMFRKSKTNKCNFFLNI